MVGSKYCWFTEGEHVEVPFSLSLGFAEKLCSAAVPQVRGVDRPSVLACSIHRDIPWAAALFQDASDILSFALSGVGGLQSEILPNGDDSAVDEEGIVGLLPEVPQALEKSCAHFTRECT